MFTPQSVIIPSYNQVYRTNYVHHFGHKDKTVSLTVETNNNTIKIEGGETIKPEDAVNFVVDGTSIPVPYKTVIGSEFVKGAMKDMGRDVEIIIPAKFTSIINGSPAITNYINFLHGNKQDIKDKDVMKLCLNMYTYFIDDNYFEYLMQKILDHWWSSGMSNMVYDDVNPDVQYDIFLRCPRDFIPDSLLSNKVFYDAWSSLNNDKKFNVNGNEVYYNNYVTRDEYGHVPKRGCVEIKTCHTIDYNIVGYDHTIIKDTINGNIISERTHNNGLPNGKWKEMCDSSSTSTSLDAEGYYINGQKHGLWKYWKRNPALNNVNEVNPVLVKEEEYENGILNGEMRKWSCYGNNSLEEDGQYVNGKKHGVWRKYHNGTLKEEEQYVNDKKHGLWTVYYSDSEYIRSKTHYSNDELHGVRKYWSYRPGNKLLDECHYVNDVLSGHYKEWYDDQNNNIKEEGEYKNGGRVGLWLSYDEDGNCIENVEY